MTPSSDKNSSKNSSKNSLIDYKFKNDLLNSIGNPNASEEEWLAACEKLGDQPLHPETRRKNASLLIGLCALGGIAVGSFVYRGVTFAAHNEGVTKQPQVATAPADPVIDVDWAPYMANLQRRIKRAWFPPKGNESQHVKVRFKVHKNGTVDHLKLWQPSGIQSCDAAALRAVENAAPYRALPVGAPEDVDIEFTFDYNVFTGHNKS